MILLLDTNALSDLMREHPGVDARLAATPESDSVVTCPIATGEVRFGIERLPDGARRRELELDWRKLTRQVECEPVPASTGEFYARAKVACQRKGEPLDENDLWIAATALALGAVLVTGDDHFERIDGLAVEDWTQ